MAADNDGGIARPPRELNETEGGISQIPGIGEWHLGKTCETGNRENGNSNKKFELTATSTIHPPKQLDKIG